MFTLETRKITHLFYCFQNKLNKPTIQFLGDEGVSILKQWFS